ncbi:hypothetical protein ALQ19_200156 [Pseudomonas syringae pv. berberidis]|nr:hypothetical protein ALQ19_200156 [Pseudomonas syringae pv. berberidis]
MTKLQDSYWLDVITVMPPDGTFRLTIRERALMEQLKNGPPFQIDASGLISALSLHGAGLITFIINDSHTGTWATLTEKGQAFMTTCSS